MVKKKNRTKQVRIARAPKRQQEMTRLGQALRSLGGLGGGVAGGIFGMPSSGAATGSSLGAALSKWLGSGDYQVSSNSMVSSMKASGSIPLMHKNDQSIVVRHKEFIGEIKSSVDYKVQYSLELNPGVAATFPWLSNIAKNYQEYRFKGVIFHYVPTSGSAVASTNNALGSVMMQTSYRATDTPPDTKREILNEYWSTETAPFESTCHPIECNPAENPFNVQYVRQTSVPAGDNLLLYDLGRTFIATSGQQIDDVILGDLWITYEVELKKPTLYSNVMSAESNLCSFFTPTGTGVVAGQYLDETTVFKKYTGNIAPSVIDGRKIEIPERFEGYIYLLCRIDAPSPYMRAGTTWSSAYTMEGPVTVANLLGNGARWDTVTAHNGTDGATIRSATLIGTFAKLNFGKSEPASIIIPEMYFWTGGATTASFSMSVIMTSTVM
nr:MAG: coat protein [brine shrimp noda-like virus 1]